MSNFSVLDNLLTPERAEKLAAIVVINLTDGLKDCMMSDDEYVEVLNQAVNSNPGVKAVLAVSDEAMVELIARIIVELQWQTIQNPSEKNVAMNGLAVYLSEWLSDKINEEDEAFDDDEAFEDDESFQNEE